MEVACYGNLLDRNYQLSVAKLVYPLSMLNSTEVVSNPLFSSTLYFCYQNKQFLLASELHDLTLGVRVGRIWFRKVVCSMLPIF